MLGAEEVTGLITALRSFFKGHTTFPQFRWQMGKEGRAKKPVLDLF